MNFNMSLPGLEPFIITNSTMKDGIFNPYGVGEASASVSQLW